MQSSKVASNTMETGTTTSTTGTTSVTIGTSSDTISGVASATTDTTITGTTSSTNCSISICFVPAAAVSIQTVTVFNSIDNIYCQVVTTCSDILILSS